jgi:F0F1-type ATP synthase assembly protein I
MIKNLLENEEAPAEPEESKGHKLSNPFAPEPTVQTLFDPHEAIPGPDTGPDKQPFSKAEYTAPTAGESIRMTGLAWSAGISLFAAIVFMMLLGWFADLLLGSAPWGLVGGIILGSIIGFIQFFRINQEILRTPGKNPKEPE